MKRYLLYYGYVGTRFSGVQKQSNLGRKDKSIVYHLNEALKSLHPLNTPSATPSSRTDSGVHALCTTFHCDLTLPPLRKSCTFRTEEDFISFSLNKFFANTAVDIRIHKTVEVPKSLDARFSALSRTYLYRFAHYLPLPDTNSNAYTIELPIIEINRCNVFSGRFDLDAAKAACNILSGTHDFSYYTKITKDTADKSFVRSLKVRIIPGTPLMNPVFDPQYENFKFYDFLATSNGFLYNQVRRLATVLVAVGKGNISLNKVKDTLNTSRWDLPYSVMSPHGLHLLSVNYSPLSFQE